eukprot:Awhi_evm1s2721
MIADYNEEFNQKWIDYFNNKNLRTSGVIRGLNDVFAHDIVPDTRICEAAFRACRRLNFYGPTVRIFEGLEDK